MHDTTTRATGPPAPTALTERRCWRCLNLFPGDADRSAPVRAEFWLCDPCQATLLPSKQRAT